MVHARSRKLHGQCHTGPLAQLVAVDPQPQAGVARSPKDPTRLILREGAALAEHVRPADVRQDGVEHGAAHQIGVLLRIGAVGDQVGAQIRDLVHFSCGDTGAAGLVLHVQPVAGLALQVRGSLRDRLGHAVPHQAGKFVVADTARGARGDGDAAGTVAFAGHACFELGRAVSGEHQVRV
ncbi:hypothetical protein D3C73_1279370 [compost metagenome]